MLALLLHIPAILAAAGSGSSSFGGGGGGGGSSFSGGGRSGSGDGDFGTDDLIALIVVGLIVVAVVAALAITAWRLRRKRRARAAQVQLASHEAAQDDAYFDHEQVTAQAAALFTEIQRDWSENDVASLDGKVGADLMTEWRRRLDDFTAKGWRNVVDVRSAPQIEYVGLVNREDDSEDRVTVRVSAKLEDRVVTTSGETVLRNGASSATTMLAEYWTLARRADRWILVSIESDAEGAHHLDAPLVPSPWSDDAHLRDEALVEGAVADKALPGFATADLVDVDLAADARAQALDLALADGRFAPDVLEVAARRAVAAWGEAIDGADDALEALAAPDAVAAMLHGATGDGRTRVVVRGARVEHIGIDALHPGDADRAATMTVTVRVHGVRYVEDRDTAAVLRGSKDAATTFTERWTFALRDDDGTPWQLVEATQPVAG